MKLDTSYLETWVLIVDDVAQNIQILGNILKNKNIKVDFALDGNTALNKLSKRTFDLILLDIMMPEMDGYELCNKIKEVQEWQEIPIIFITAKSEPEDLVKAFELGAVDYIQKPFNQVEVGLRVESQLNIQKSKQQLEILNHFKDKVLTLIAHDLRAPAGLIVNAAEMFKKAHLATDWNRMGAIVDVISKSAIRLNLLLDNLMAWARSQKRDQLFVIERLAVRQILGRTKDILSENIQEKKIVFENKIEEKEVLYSDIFVLNTLLRNLISNAIKYSNFGGIITVESANTDGYYSITVKDNGLGMDFETIEQIKSRKLIHPKQGTVNQDLGSGLGLILCQELLQQIKGSLVCESEIGKGSTFTITLVNQNPI